MSDIREFTLQTLAPESARLALGVEKFMRREPDFDPAGGEIVIACSGGADSKALFFILLALRSRMGFTLSLAHLDHAFREESAAEREAVEKLASTYGIKAYTTRMDVSSLSQKLKLGKEEAGRVARLQFFQSIRKNRPDCWIALGHQLNDLAEDVLMRLMRGSGWPALSGMTALDRRTGILRPLLLTPRAGLEEFLASLGEDWVTDAMNADTAFLRNRVRAEVLPLFIRENPSFLENVADLWTLGRMDGDLFTGLLKPVNKAAKGGGLFTLTQAQLANLPKALRLRAYKEKLESLGPGQPLLRNLLALDRAYENKKGGAVIQFPGNKTATVRRGEIVFARG